MKRAVICETNRIKAHIIEDVTRVISVDKLVELAIDRSDEEGENSIETKDE